MTEEQKACSHKFVDSKHCLKCGWVGMNLLNAGCGGNRPGKPWQNVDQLRSFLKPGTPERINLDKEDNYYDWDIRQRMAGPLFPERWFDGCLLSHVIEHMDCHEAARVLSDCRDLLIPGGVLVVSVPDAEYFLKHWHNDTRERAVELFGEPIAPEEPWHKSFFDYALFHPEHKQVFTPISLQCVIMRAGFKPPEIFNFHSFSNPVINEIEKIMNRRKFSLEAVAVKASEP